MSSLLDPASIRVQNQNGKADIFAEDEGVIVRAQEGISEDVTVTGNTNVEAVVAVSGTENNMVVVAPPTGDTTSYTVNLSSGSDIVNIKGGNIAALNTGAGNDIIKIDGGTVGTINTGAGNDIVQANGLSNTTITNASGNDIVNLNGNSTNVTINGGNTTDIINIRKEAGDNNIVYGNGGNDIITVSGGKGHQLVGGAGNDKYIISKLENGGSYIIDQTGAGAKDRDTLVLSNYNAFGSDYSGSYLDIEFDNGNTILHYDNGEVNATITIINNEEHSLNTVVFGDITIHADELNPDPYSFELGAKDKDREITGTDHAELIKIDNTSGIVLDTAGGDDYVSASNSNNLNINLGSENDIFYGSDIQGLVLNAGTGNDEITVYSDNSDVSIDAGDGDDIISFSGGYTGNAAVVKGGNGNDAILLNEFDGGTFNLYGGNGNDNYYINWNNYADKPYLVNINNSEDSNAIGSVCKETINICNAQKSDFDILVENNCLKLTAKNGSGIITIHNLDRNIIENITFTLADGPYSSEINSFVPDTVYSIQSLIEEAGGSSGGVHSDVHVLTSANSNQTITGDNHAEEYTVDGADGITLNTLAGDDRVYLTDTGDSYINTGAGQDYIVVNEGTPIPSDFNHPDPFKEVGNMTIHAGADNDTIEVNDGFSMFIYGDDGDDSITINGVRYGGGGGFDVHGGEGNDTLTVSAANINTTLDGGNGNDTYVVNWNNNQYVSIENTQTDGRSGNDTLKINGISKDSLTFNLRTDDYTGDSILYISNTSTNSSININHWQQNPFTSVTINDVVYTMEELLPAEPPVDPVDPPEDSKTLTINDGQNYGEVAFGQAENGEITGYTVNLVDGQATSLYAAKDTSETSVTASYNTVNVSGGSFVNSQGGIPNNTGSEIVEVAGAKISSGSATYNSVTVTGGSVNNVYGARGGNASNNSVTVSGSETITVYGNVLGARSSNGNVTNNHVEITNANITNNIVYQNGSSYTDTNGYVYGARAQGVHNAIGNSVLFNSGSVNAIYGGRSESGEASMNIVTINGGKVETETTAAGYVDGGRSTGGNVQENKVYIKGGTIDAVVRGGRNTGSANSSYAQQNEVNISGGQVLKNVYGGYVSSGQAYNNSVSISSGTAMANVYGGYATSGSASLNSVTLSGNAFVAANVYDNYSESGTTGDGTVTVSDNAEVQGTIFGGSGVDTITVNGGIVNTINGNEGNDIITVNSGTVGTIIGGAGNDSISIDWLAVGGNITIDQEGNGTGVDSLTINGVSSTNFSYAKDGDALVMTDVVNGKILIINGWDNGLNTITFADGEKTEADLMPPAPQYYDTIVNSNENITWTPNELNNRIILEGYNSRVEISGYNNDTIIDITSLNGHDSDYDFERAGQNLVMTVKGANAGESATITFTNYFNGSNRPHIVDGEMNGIVFAGTDAADSFNADDNFDRGNNAVVYLAGAGDDIITANTNGYYLKGEAGNDTFNISNSERNTIDGGTGSDIYNITWTDGNHLAIEDSVVNAGDKETINILNRDFADFTFEKLDGGQLLVHDNSGGYLNIIFGEDTLNASNFSGINFRDGLKTVDDMFPRPTYNGTADNETITTTGYDIIYGGGGSDTIGITDNGNTIYTGTDREHPSDSQADVIYGGVELTERGYSYGSAYPDVNDNIVYGSNSSNGDRIIIFGSRNQINAGDGNDTIYIGTTENGGNNVVHGDGGRDIVSVQFGNDNIVYGDEGSDIYQVIWNNVNGTVINNTTAAGSDYDTLQVVGVSANSLSYSYDADTDTLVMSDGTKNLSIVGWRDHSIQGYTFSDGTFSHEQLREIANLGGADDPAPEEDDFDYSQSGVIKKLMHSLDTTKKTGFDAVDEAVVKCSNGLYSSLGSLIDNFIYDCLNNTGTSNSQAQKDFLLNYCGINMDNDDTGAITGSDAGGSVVKDKEDIVPEIGFTEDAYSYDTSDFIQLSYSDVHPYYRIDQNANIYGIKVDNVTFYWSDDNIAQYSARYGEDHMKRIISGIVNIWASPAMELVRESYNISLDDAGSTWQKMADGSSAIQIVFDLKTKINSEGQMVVDNTLAAIESNYSFIGNTTISTLGALVINIGKFGDIDLVGENGDPYNPNGTPYTGSGYFDRLIAHEMVHAIMGANINMFGDLPVFLKEGLAELVHGVDDERGYELINHMTNINYSGTMTDRFNEVTESDLKDLLHFIFNTDNNNNGKGNNNAYAGGYMLLRYLAKQVAGYSPTVGENLEITDGSSAVMINAAEAASGNLSNNSVTLTSGSANDVFVAIDSREEYDATIDTVRVDADHNSVTIGASGIVSRANDEHAGNVRAAYVVNGSASENTATLDGGTVEGELIVAEIEKGMAFANTVNINSGSARVVGGALGAEADATHNIVNVTGGDVSEYVFGGAAVVGTVLGNKVNLTGGTINGSVYGGMGTELWYESDNASESFTEVTENKVELNGSTVKGDIYGGYALAGTVKSNSVDLNNVDLTHINANGYSSVYGGYGEGTTTVKFNTVELKGGSIYNITGGYSENGVAAGNTVRINGGNVLIPDTDYICDDGIVQGGCTVNGEASYNRVGMGHGTVICDVAGGVAEGSGNAVHNSVDIIGGTVNGDIYGGYSETGHAADNEVSISNNARVQNIYINYSESGTTGGGKAEISDTAIVAGTIYGGEGSDTITITGGSVNAIEVNAGDDFINVQGGTVGTINGGDGIDTITITGGQVNAINVGAGDDVISVNGGAVAGTIYGGLGSDTYNIAWQSGNQLVIEDSVALGGDIETIKFTNMNKEDFVENFNVQLLSDGKLQLHEKDGDGYLTVIFGDNTVTSTNFKGIEFADDSVLGVEEIVPSHVKIGDDSNDRLDGTVDFDIIRGGAGSAYLFGDEGNDLIEGGKGDDTLVGGAGNDTYVWSKGDGNDTIILYKNSSQDYGKDILVLRDVAKNDVVFRQSGDNGDKNLYLCIGEEKITLQTWFNESATNGLSKIVFSDGEMTEEEIDSAAVLDNYLGLPHIFGLDNRGDKVVLNDTITSSVRTSSGDDNIVVNNASGLEIQSGEGDDIIVVNGGSGATIYPGKGNDKITMAWGTVNQIVLAGNTNEDVKDLVITGWTDSQDPALSLNGDTMTVSDSQGNRLTISYWNTGSSLNSITFKNGDTVVQEYVSESADLNSALRGLESACLSFADTQVTSLVQTESLTDTDNSYLANMTIASSNNTSH